VKEEKKDGKKEDKGPVKIDEMKSEL